MKLIRSMRFVGLMAAVVSLECMSKIRFGALLINVKFKYMVMYLCNSDEISWTYSMFGMISLNLKPGLLHTLILLLVTYYNVIIGR